MDGLNDLAVAARNGDRNALAALLGRLQSEVWRYCAAMVGTDDADDAAQEAMIRIVTAMPSYGGTAPARVWVMGVVRHTCLDWLRSAYRRRALLDRVQRQVVDGPHSEHGWTETADLLAHLDPDRREAFVLTQLLGFSYDLAAETCGCAVGTIRSRVARARIDLLRAVEAADAGEVVDGREPS